MYSRDIHTHTQTHTDRQTHTHTHTHARTRTRTHTGPLRQASAPGSDMERWRRATRIPMWCCLCLQVSWPSLCVFSFGLSWHQSILTRILCDVACVGRARRCRQVYSISPWFTCVFVGACVCACVRACYACARICECMRVWFDMRTYIHTRVTCTHAGLAVAERHKTRVIQRQWRQAAHLAALHELASAERAKAKVSKSRAGARSLSLLLHTPTCAPT